MTWQQFQPIHFYMRKGGHVFGYGLLSILLFRAWRETLPALGNPRWTYRWANIAVLGTAFVASLDEWHQSFLPSAPVRPTMLYSTLAPESALRFLCFFG